MTESTLERNSKMMPPVELVKAVVHDAAVETTAHLYWFSGNWSFCWCELVTS